jgi:hypothetical protein
MTMMMMMMMMMMMIGRRKIETRRRMSVVITTVLKLADALGPCAVMLSVVAACRPARRRWLGGRPAGDSRQRGEARG